MWLNYKSLIAQLMITHVVLFLDCLPETKNDDWSLVATAMILKKRSKAEGMPEIEVKETTA